jgi:hypothetical protein
LWLFSFSIANSTSKALGSGTSGSAVKQKHFCLKNYFFSTTNSLKVKTLEIHSMFTQFIVQNFNAEFLIVGWMSLFKFSIQVFSLSSSLVQGNNKMWDASHKLQYTPLDHVESDLRH